MTLRRDFQTAIFRPFLNASLLFTDSRCFPGAWYYKVKTPRGPFLGMKANLTLPRFYPDESRVEYLEDARFEQGKMKRYLDTPSVYLGGCSDHECDIGFGWFHGLVEGKLSVDKITFRPFWRTIHVQNGKEVNQYRGTSLEETQYYFFPGDRVEVKLLCEVDDTLSFYVTLLEETTLEPYRSIRIQNATPQPLVVKDLIAPGNGTKDTEYKRVNAIDQYHNEGKPTQSTSAQAIHAIWEDVTLYYQDNRTLCYTPMEGFLQTRILCPHEDAFSVTKTNHFEVVSIRPQKK